MGEVIPIRAGTLLNSVRRELRVRRVAVELIDLPDGRFEVLLRREGGHAPVCCGVYPDHARAWQVAHDRAERLGLPLVDRTARVEF